jgi:hypothetical protein
MALASILSILAAAEVNGKWGGKLDSGEGELQFSFKVDGSALSGSMSGVEGKPFPLTGKLDGDKISFTVEAEYQGNPVKLVLNGQVTGEEMKLNISTADASWSSSLTAKKLP